MGSISVSALSGLASLIGVLFPVLAILLIATRTRRSHSFLMHRLWQIIYGPREIEDPLVKKHVDEETVVAVFRTRYNIPIDTVSQAHRLINWAKPREISMRAIGACGFYFDFIRCEIRPNLPSPRKMKALAVFVVFLGICALGIFSLGTKSSVLAQFKESKRYFLISRDAATPLFPQGPVLTRDVCLGSTSAKRVSGEFSPTDREIICKALTEDDEIKSMNAFVKQGLRAQRLLLAMFLSATLIVAFLLFGTVQQLRATYRLRRTVEDKASGPSADACHREGSTASKSGSEPAFPRS
jgi:ABC-type Fe3+-siderophore transport system permease subunit